VQRDRQLLVPSSRIALALVTTGEMHPSSGVMMARRLHSLRLSILFATGITLAACSAVDRAIVSTENGASRIFSSAPTNAPPPAIDMNTLSWRNLNATSPAQFALVDSGDPKSGTSQVVLKLPAGESIPPFWQEAPGSYVVISGTFVVEGVDADGRPQRLAQGPGTKVSIPARMIQKLATTAAGEGTMLLTMQGYWQPNFVDDASAQHASN